MARHIVVRLAALCLALLSAPAFSAAAFLQHNTRATFDLLVGMQSIENFADTTLVPGLTVVSDAGSINTITGRWQDHVHLPGFQNTIFGFPLSPGFGGDFALFTGVGGAPPMAGLRFTVTFADNSQQLVPFELQPEGYSGFFGFTASTPFKSVNIEAGSFPPGSGGQGYQLDDLAFGNNVAAIPEPSTYALMLAGLGLIAWIARRRTMDCPTRAIAS